MTMIDAACAKARVTIAKAIPPDPQGDRPDHEGQQRRGRQRGERPRAAGAVPRSRNRDRQQVAAGRDEQGVPEAEQARAAEQHVVAQGDAGDGEADGEELHRSRAVDPARQDARQLDRDVGQVAPARAAARGGARNLQASWACSGSFQGRRSEEEHQGQEQDDRQVADPARGVVVGELLDEPDDDGGDGGARERAHAADDDDDEGEDQQRRRPGRARRCRRRRRRAARPGRPRHRRWRRRRRRCAAR